MDSPSVAMNSVDNIFHSSCHAGRSHGVTVVIRIVIFVLVGLAPLAGVAQPIKSALEMKIPQSLTEWQRQRQAIRDTLIKLMGDLPPTPPVTNVVTLSREDKGSYMLEKFEFDNGAGAMVPGWILIPKTGLKKYPAIYYCHWHGGNYDLGKAELFSTHHTPQVPAEVLTQMGYVVIAIDAYCFGERSGKGPGGPEEKGSAEEMSTSKYELWQGRSLWSMMVRDDQMALNYLFARPEVDAGRVAVTGISMGATRSWWLMALDERIRTGVAVGCMTRYQELIAEQKIKAHGIYYFVPGMLKHFDTEAIISLIAPRPVLFMTGDEDIGSPVSGILKIEKVVKNIYLLNGAGPAFENIIYPHTGHVYTPDMWNRMTKWMMVNLK
jgi:dienelactone hydrolase